MMHDWPAFLLILLLGAIGVGLFFHEPKGRSWTGNLLQPVGCLLLLSLVLRLVARPASPWRIRALLLVLAGALVTRNYLGLRHWRKTGDRAGLWSTVGLDVLVLVGVAAGLVWWGF